MGGRLRTAGGWCCRAEASGSGEGGQKKRDAMLERWARAVGIDHDKVQMGVTADGLRGAVATDDIADGEVPLSHARKKHSVCIHGLFY